MKKYLLSLFILVSFCNVIFAQEEVELFSKNSESIPHTKYGMEEFDTLIFLNFILPQEVVYGLKASVKISFLIDTLGNIDSVTVPVCKVTYEETHKNAEDSILNSFKFNCMTEVKRVMSLTNGLWVCAKNNGKPKNQKVFFNQIISAHTFSLFYQVKEDPFNRTIDYVLKFGKEKHQYLYNTGVRKLQKAMFDLSKVYFEESLKDNQQDRDALYNLGICYFKMNDKTHACTCWKMASKLGDQEAGKLLSKYCAN